MKLIAAISLFLLAPEYTLVDEPVYIFVHNDKRGDHECSIDIHLDVYGPKMAWCVRKLESAAHAARAEMSLQR